MKLMSRSLPALGVAVALVLAASLAGTSRADDDTAVQQTDRQGKLFFGGLYSTLTRLSVSLTTTGTRYFTCISAIDNSQSCTGRRRRRNIVPALELGAPAIGGPVPVYSSQNADAEAGVHTDSEVRDPKAFFLTIFTTTTSSITLGTYFSDTGTTVSLSVACFDPSFSFPPTC